ncbi:D-glycerate 2-kinase [subsurface metagenome]
MTLPIEGLSLEDIKKITEVLLRSGADVEEVNTVRAAIIELSNGRLAKHIHPAEIINLVVNDGVWGFSRGWKLESCALGWGPSVPVPEPDQNDLELETSTLQKYSSCKELPDSVRKGLVRADAGSNAQNVKDFEELGIKYHTFVLADPEDSAEAAIRGAEEMGLSSMILTSTVEGEAGDVGIVFASIAKEIVKNNRPLKPPCVVIVSGETTVTIVGEHRERGRNQELGDAILFNEPGNNVCDLSLIIVTD